VEHYSHKGFFDTLKNLFTGSKGAANLEIAMEAEDDKDEVNISEIFKNSSPRTRNQILQNI